MFELELEQRVLHEAQQRSMSPSDLLNSLLTESEQLKQLSLANEQLRQKLDNLEFQYIRYLKQQHHRTKNSLQLLAAMLDSELHKQLSPEISDRLLRFGRATRMLSLLHDQFSRVDNLTEPIVSARDFLGRVIFFTQNGFPDRPIELSLENIDLSYSRALAFGIIIGELVDNALRHGKGKIYIELTSSNTMSLKIKDEGPGFPMDFEPTMNFDTGLEIVTSMVRRDLQGSISYTNDSTGGALVLVTFPM